MLIIIHDVDDEDGDDDGDDDDDTFVTIVIDDDGYDDDNDDDDIDIVASCRTCLCHRTLSAGQVLETGDPFWEFCASSGVQVIMHLIDRLIIIIT